MANTEILILTLLLTVVGILLYVTFFKKETKQDDSNAFLMLQQRLDSLTRTLDVRIGETSEKMYESLEKQSEASRRLVQDIRDKVETQLMGVVKGVTEVSESSKQVFTVAEQLKQLQDILKNPKQRGVLGEYYLEAVLQNVLPPGSYQMQYAFDNGEIVDAVVFVKGKVIPIDSKFSLENYNRYVSAKDPIEKVQLEKQFVNDLKLRIQETSKYIRPAEKTTDFAFMFIPSEGIYYELLSNTIGGGEENLIQRSAGKYKVIIVSPTSFLAYLQTVLQGLKALEIEERAIDIIKNVEKLGTHIAKYEEFYKKLGNTLETTVNHYNAGYKELGKIDKDVTRITGSTAGIEPLPIEGPRDREAA
jgi:DNA recombination protein RmuC